MKSRFRITVGSEPDFEDLVGDLYCDGEILCVITQENGWSAAEVRICARSDGGDWKFALADFEQALASLKVRLLELQRCDGGNGGPPGDFGAI